MKQAVEVKNEMFLFEDEYSTFKYVIEGEEKEIKGSNRLDEGEAALFCRRKSFIEPDN